MGIFDGWFKGRDSAAVQAQDSAEQGGDGTTAQRAFRNTKTGSGTDSDILANLRLQISRGLNKTYLETLFVNFWAAGKIVDMKPNDVFGPGIVWSDDEDAATLRMIEEMERLEVMQKVPQAVQAARLFGTALLILAPRDRDFTKPLRPDDVRLGEISHLIVADRFRLEELIAEGNPTHPKFGKVETYRWYFQPVTGTMVNPESRTHHSHIDIHASRCIRFDGIPPVTTDGWERAGTERWGTSVLARAIDDILQDASLAAALPDLAHRAGVPIIKKANWTEVLSRDGGEVFEGELSPAESVKNIGDNLAGSKLIVIDKEDDVAQLSVTIAGLNDIAKTATQRLAMIDGIPITRFTGESATGLSATGDGEARDWRITVEAYRKASIEPQWNRLMGIVAQNAGLAETPDWTWGRLGDETLDEQVNTTKTLSESVRGLVATGVLEVDEGREILNASPLVNVDPDDVPAMEEDEMMGEKASGEKSTPT